MLATEKKNVHPYSPHWKKKLKTLERKNKSLYFEHFLQLKSLIGTIFAGLGNLNMQFAWYLKLFLPCIAQFISSLIHHGGPVQDRKNSNLEILPSGYLTVNGSSWKITMLNRYGKLTISMGHLYHGYVTNNQRVSFINILVIQHHIHLDSRHQDRITRGYSIRLSPAPCHPRNANHLWPVQAVQARPFCLRNRCRCFCKPPVRRPR